MSSSRNLATFSVLAAAFIALVASYILTSPPSSSKFYCVLPNTHITTLNTSLPEAKCFRVENGVFIEVLAERPEYENGQEEIVQLDGYIIPGIIESHGHILAYGEMLESVELYGAKSMTEVRERISDFLKRHVGEGYGGREKWIRGIGWDQKFFGGVMPTAKELSEDPELKDLYMMLDRVDVHCVLTSQKVLDLLPYPPPEAPPGGVIITDPGPGVFCDNAMDAIIYPLAPKPDTAQKTRWFKTAMKELNKLGIVGMGDAGMRVEDVKILEEMEESGDLTVRMNVMLECAERNTFCPDDTDTLALVTKEDGPEGSMLILGGVKLFADGALGSWGAALLEPYSDKEETSGTMLINETELTSVVKNWFDAGFQVNIHAIGDKANRATVDAFENVLGKDCDGCNEVWRLRIEHAQIIHPNDQKRITKMGIIPSIQPTHATSDMAYAESRLGAERIFHSAYRMRSLFPSSSSTSPYPGPVLGSDFPVEPPNPLHGMYAAVTRLNPATGTSPSGDNGWHTEEALTVEQALVGFTRNAGYGWKRDGVVGTIAENSWADWVVLDRDLLEDKTGKSLRDVVVKETWVGGKKVYPVLEEPVDDDWARKARGVLNRFLEWAKVGAKMEL